MRLEISLDCTLEELKQRIFELNQNLLTSKPLVILESKILIDDSKTLQSYGFKRLTTVLIVDI